MKSLAAIALAVSAVALPAEPPGHTMSVPIVYNAHAKPNLRAVISKVNIKYGTLRAWAPYTNGTGNATTTPTDENDQAYITEVQIGTPGQKLRLNFDTGSSDLWVYSNDTAPGIADGATLYLPGNSSTTRRAENETWSIGYGKGAQRSSGVVYRDVVAIGGLAVPNQGVQSAVQASPGFVGDGMLGLGYDSGSSVTPTKERTWFSNIKFSLKAPLFTVRLRHQANGSYNFGYIDESQYSGDIVYTPAFSDKLGHRLFKADGYAIGDGPMVNATFNATPDTGSSLILIANSAARAYWAKVPGSEAAYDDSGELYFTYPCNETQRLPDFSVGVGGKRITVPGRLVRYATLEDGRCYGGIAGVDVITRDLAVLGGVFLKAFFTVFDDGHDRIGFAVGK